VWGGSEQKWMVTKKTGEDPGTWKCVGEGAVMKGTPKGDSSDATSPSGEFWSDKTVRESPTSASRCRKKTVITGRKQNQRVR